MPHGRLTPLGRQLASVLANLRPASPCASFGRRAQAQRSLSVDNTVRTRAGSVARKTHDVKAARIRGHSLAAAAVREEADEDVQGDLYQSPQFDDKGDEEYVVGRLGGIENEGAMKQEWQEDRRGKTGRSNSSSNSVHHRSPIRYTPSGDIDASLLRDKAYPMYYAKGDPTVELQLEAILYRYIEHQATMPKDANGKPVDSFELSEEDTTLLESREYSTLKIKYWADIVINSDQHDIATRLANLKSQESLNGVPLFVLFHLLRKPYVSARTLRVLLRVAFRTLEESHPFDKEDIFTLFALSLRRIRDVWPAAMERLVDMLLRYLPHAQSPAMVDSADKDSGSVSKLTNEESGLRRVRLASLAFRLNKAMRLLAIPTSVNPFLNVATQETCVIRILRFLAEHEPPLEINRDGFRAVTLIQLAQPKSEDDRLWAELKTLSWPPWKQDRTAMDADITAGEHGRSKAAETLERMREAGFAPYEWERVAPTYAGWDSDGTPTIQTRVWFGSGKKRFQSGAAAWTARIQTTRTIQEAWACYLAYENDCDAPDQDVCLAMFRKIYEEDQRVQHTRKYEHFRKIGVEKWVWPGDAREVEPPPPSAHQHTYTRTPPPNLDGFYRQLREKGVVFEGPCFAFILSRASSLKLGIEYLLASGSVYPAVRGLLDDTCDLDITTVPDVVFAGFMELLSRFSNFSLSKAAPNELQSLRRLYVQTYDFLDLKLNADHALARGSILLKRRLPHYRPAWNAVLRSLGNSSSHLMLNATLASTPRSKSTSILPLPDLDATEQSFKAAHTAVGLVRRVVDTMQSINLEPDSIGFMALCHVMENWLVTCWMQLRQQALHGTSLDAEIRAKPLKIFYRRVMKAVFYRFVGAEEPVSAGQKELASELPLVLEVPNPAILHAYIRVLGWMREYGGLRDIVQLMLKYRAEFQQRREMDRNGEVIMRRAIVGLRVFLERSWLADFHSNALVSEINKQTKVDFGEKLEHTRHAHDREDAKLASLKYLWRFEQPAKHHRVMEIKELVESVEEWGGWPTDEEVEAYCQHPRFQQFNR